MIVLKMIVGPTEEEEVEEEKEKKRKWRKL